MYLSHFDKGLSVLILCGKVVVRAKDFCTRKILAKMIKKDALVNVTNVHCKDSQQSLLLQEINLYYVKCIF